jgi:uncharacterized Zn finger protein (UPF0148 family)
MSDFDEEAERERLREKYEQDREKREATEQMSELLLQGATMTNAHCSECGDPVFRYEGQEFCATCERAIDRNGSGGTGDEQGESDEQEASEDTDQGTVEVTEPSNDRRVVFGGDEDGQAAPAESENSGPRAPDQRAESDARRRVDDEAEPPARQNAEPPARQDAEPPARRETEPPAERPTSDVPARSDERAPGATGDIGAARAALTRTLVRFSERAEATDDPRQAREHLEAAREAAAALAELRR